MSDFGAAVARLRAAMGGNEPWDLPELPEREGPSDELRAKRRAGRAAYERAMRARGAPRSGIYARFAWEDEED